jgi:membrane fusion protein (multidrug efflux system)
MSSEDSIEPPAATVAASIPRSYTETDPRTPDRSMLTRLRLPIMGAVVLIALIAGLVIYLTGGRYESTDDAAIQGGRVNVSSTIAGRVVEIDVHEGQMVHAGALLFKLDGAPYQAAYDEAQAAVATARLQIAGLQATYRQRQADQKAAEDSFAYLQREAARQKGLVAAGTSSQAQADQAANQVDQARQQVAAASEQTANALAALGGKPGSSVETQPAVQQAQARLATARLNKGYVEVYAPQDGIVTKVDQLQVGDYVNVATPVFSLVSASLWIEANFKENQLEYMRAGQAATVKVDAFPDVRFKAHVQAISPGTGSSFSLLPPENATGNWVKVTQRVPVRIEFDGHPEVPLQAGLSASVKVDTTHHRTLFGSSGPRAQTQASVQPAMGAAGAGR